MTCTFREAYDKYFSILARFKWVVIVFWLAALGFGFGFGLQFLSAVSIEVDAPKGTRGYDAQHAFRDLFPDHNQQSYLLYFECKNCETAVNNNTRRQVEDSIRAAGSWKDGYLQGYQSYWSFPPGPGYDPPRNRLLSQINKRAMVAVINTSPEFNTADLKSFVTHMRDNIKRIRSGGDYIGFLGSQAVLVDSVEESSTTITEIDLIVLPLALSVLVYVVGSWRMVIIPIINVGTTLLASFAIMYGLTTVTAKAPSFVPSVMEAMVMALSIDYSLFILTRYRYELSKNHRRGVQAVQEAVYHAGEVVFMSGMTLVSCFLGMCGFPTQTVYMVGVGCALCLTMALLINLTMTPALLLAFPKFFTKFQLLPFCTRLQDFSNRYDDLLDEEDSKYVLADTNDHQNPYSVPRRESTLSQGMQAEAYAKSEKEKLEKSYWYTSTRRCIKWPYVFLTILVPLGLIAPAAVHLLDFKYSMSNEQIAPRNSLSTQCQDHVKRNFPLGLMNPLYVLVDASQLGPNSVETDDFFNITATISELLVQDTQCTSEQVNSIAYVKGMPLDLEKSKMARQLQSYYNDFYNLTVNHYKDAALIQMTVPFAPYGDDTVGFSKTVRSILDRGYLQRDGFKYYLVGYPIWIVDTVNLTYELFPYIILATVLAIFFFISVLLMSASVPLRYAFTLVFPLSFIFGVAVLIYQEGALNGLHWAALENSDGMYWLTPIITFPICTGLALDYDIFLICRVIEYRKMGFTDKASILKAVHETGGIITAAGIIMAIAFGGMMFSQTDTLNQIAWILFSSVLFDTFVVRTILVPAVLTLGGPVNWWPRRVPKNNLKNEFGEEMNGESDIKAGSAQRLFIVNK